ncbi:FadR/GntR family transcriptional regulator [Microbacterium sp. 1.5R]|uniref:FadR/GntR family transcriptional regulator n=1 Tax=Microbacterium sp. 1.5R TaxID=1916917 RepID=UPI001C92DA77|nr:FCD domain-containing protein [Microbacterium sp. 1.5R]
MDLASPALGAIRRTTAVDTVRARISLAVELGMLAPGQRLPSTDDTARAFEVSEMTVRRAYRALSDEGVVVRRKGHAGGTFIADAPAVGTVGEIDAYRADAAHVHALIDQRAALEAGLAAIAGASASAGEDALARLDTLVDEMRTVPDWTGFRTADAEFHEVLVGMAGVAGAAELHHRISHELYAYFIPYRIDYLRESNEEHARLVDALRSKDAAAASRLAFDHVAELHGSMYVGSPRA